MLVRIGIHTGDCVAGILGKRAPKYVLFGKDISLANKFEETGKPMMVHISATTKKCLDDIGGYTTELRAQEDEEYLLNHNVPYPTYWLTEARRFEYTAKRGDADRLERAYHPRNI